MPDDAAADAAAGVARAGRQPRLLAVDTSTDLLTVAACAGDAESLLEAEGGARASATLIEAALERVRRCGLQLGELDAIAYARGPGAFTGLRVACAVAQGLALGASLPLLAIDSLMIVAEAARVQCSRGPGAIDIDVAVDARMGEIYAASYRWDGAWSVLAEPMLCDAEALVDRWKLARPAIVTGSALPLHASLREIGAEQVVHAAGRAAALLRLSRAAHAEGRWLDAADALPLYLRDKVALTTAEREARRSAAEAAG